MNIWAYPDGWPVPPQVLLACLVVEVLYFRGWQLLLRAEQRKAARTAPGLTGSPQSGWYRWDSWLWRGIYFLGAILVVLIDDSAPVDILSGRYFWVHMVQHLALLVIIAPLLASSAPLLPLWLGLPVWARKLFKLPVKLKVGLALYWIVHWLRQPAISCVLLIAGLWIWHWPPLYDLALRDQAIHDWGEHLTFLAVSCLFWTQVIPSPPLRPRLGYMGQMVCIGVAMVQNVALAVLLGFSQVPLYAPYAHLAAAFGGAFTALQDQQLGAGIMWTFGDVPFGIAMSILFQRWFATQSDDAGLAVEPRRITER